ncbi:serine/threonine-protein kinase [Stigmatella sp. ncwal1]|uniref:Serine/threonine-protein kinase n=1 Tax=Stigmatella ashevillensis TaxID=2995309 RepID=A0ABT5D4D5_9BACT|nr:serine/threonine-protein kinase [Stigmatella ashevillena]MDC0707688.1 serine/threonine-protein kinase [Stigmatella ashevillena]
MRKKNPLLEVDPLCLPMGMRVGHWRIQGWRGRGAYGTLYRVEREGREGSGSFALKLAIAPEDPRFEREALLLSRIQSPHVPRLLDQGVWEHPSGAHPYLVMEWVEGESLYAWAARRNPTSRQVLRLLAQVARALEATHAAGGTHRDVKGDNVLVCPRDERVFLTDFGAGHFRGAGTLTSKLLPPGTPAYRSPEAWAFLRVFRRHPTAHYPASACDDLFALGVMAYRLVTDEYPPPTFPDEPSAKVWREDGPGPQRPRSLNPNVSPALETAIMRLLSTAPVDRFNGMAREAAETLEQAVQSPDPEMDALLFSVGQAHCPRWRTLEGLRLVAEQDAAPREEVENGGNDKRDRAVAKHPRVWPHAPARAWAIGAAVVCTSVMFTLMSESWRQAAPQLPDSPQGVSSREGESVAVGNSVMFVPHSSSVQCDPISTLGLPLPEKPFPGQRKPPCEPRFETAIRGSCWVELKMAPPCGNNAFDWEGGCYIPSANAPRKPTSNPQERR